MADDEDGGIDVSDSFEWPEVAYTDFVAERADAFGTLALKLGMVDDEKIKELGLAMLRTIIRSVKTPPDATISEVQKVGN
jgi:hypothetical protein